MSRRVCSLLALAWCAGCASKSAPPEPSAPASLPSAVDASAQPTPTDDRAMERVQQALFADFQSCAHEAAPHGDYEPAGKVVIHLVIDRDGHVTSTTATGLRNAAVEACVVRDAKLHVFSGGLVGDLDVQLSF